MGSGLTLAILGFIIILLRMKIVKERRKQTSENPGTAAEAPEAPEAPEAHVRRFVTVINVYKRLESFYFIFALVGEVTWTTCCKRNKVKM